MKLKKLKDFKLKPMKRSSDYSVRFDLIKLQGGLFHAKCTISFSDNLSTHTGYGTSFFWFHAKRMAYSEAWERKLSKSLSFGSAHLLGTAVHSNSKTSRVKAVSELIERECLYKIFSERLDSLVIKRLKKFTDGDQCCHLLEIVDGSKLTQLLWIKSPSGWSYLDAVHEDSKIKKYYWSYQALNKAKTLFSEHSDELLKSHERELGFFSILNPRQSILLNLRIEKIKKISFSKSDRLKADFSISPSKDLVKTIPILGTELYFSYAISKKLPPFNKQMLAAFT